MPRASAPSQPEHGPLWQRVSDELAQMIRAETKPGARFLSADEISERYGVSNITSRRVLGELASMGLIEKGRGKGCVVKGAKSERAFLLVDFEEGLASISLSYLFSCIHKGLTRGGIENNLTIELVTPQYVKMSGMDTEKIKNIVTLQELPRDQDLAALMRSGKLNCVVCHTLGPIEGVRTIRDDLKGGAVSAVEHLIRKGHTRIAHLTSDSSNQWFASRFEGYYETLRRHQLGVKFSLVAEASPFTYDSCAKAMEKVMAADTPPDALFAATDLHAVHVLEFCARNHISVPGDLAVIGFDNRPESAICDPPLTTIDTFWERQGVESMRLLRRMIDGTADKSARDMVIAPKLIARRST